MRVELMGPESYFPFLNRADQCHIKNNIYPVNPVILSFFTPFFKAGTLISQGFTVKMRNKPKLPAPPERDATQLFPGCRRGLVIVWVEMRL
jgi:hypothetical protein